jgi:uncharacterized membrane protein (DUF2068 family)
METRRWINHSLPQTLHAATLLLYITAAFSLLFGAGNPVLLVIAAARVAAGYGIANELRWGYQLALAMAFLPFVLRFLFLGLGGILGFSLFSLMFEIVLIVLLLHPQSREHQRIWFS